MPLTDQQVIDKLRNRGISTDLDDDEIKEAIAAWIEIVQTKHPLEALGQFDTVANQQEYDLFGSGKPLDGGLEVLEIYGSPAGCDQGLDIFGITPILQDVGIAPPFDRDNYVFNIPGDFLINDRVWAAYRSRFGTVRFTVKESRDGSPILLDPPPSEVKTLTVRYTRPRTSNEARQDDGTLLAGVEWKCLEFLARKFALVAGAKIGEHSDSGATARLYRDMADKAEAKAMARLDSQFGSLISAATRS